MVFKALLITAAVLSGLSLLGAIFRPAARSSFMWATLVAALAAGGAYGQSFGLVVVTLPMTFWALITALPTIDFTWRSRLGLVLYSAAMAVLMVYPTWHDERYGRDDFANVAQEQRAGAMAGALAGNEGFGRFLRAHIPFRLVRGLDLKGGLRLAYTVEVEEAIKDRRDRLYDDVRSAMATTFGFHDAANADTRATVEEMQRLSEKLTIRKSRDKASQFVVEFKDVADAVKLDSAFVGQFRELQVRRDADGKTLTFAVRSEVETQVRQSAVTQAKDTILRRVDGLGLREASVTVRDEDIIVEVPGDDERAFAEIRDIISKTARLEFKMVDDEADFFARFRDLEKEKLPTGARFEVEQAPVGPGKTKMISSMILIRGENEDMKATRKRFEDWFATQQVPDDHEVGFERWQDTPGGEDAGWRTYYLHSKADIIGDMVRDAQAVPDQGDSSIGGWYVSLEFTPRGGEIFEAVTGANIQRRFSILLDGEVRSAPRIISKIAGGRASITMGSGDTTRQQKESKDLELVLRSGALPAPIVPANEQRIGPSLGQDSIAHGLKAASVGAMLVLVGMVLYYRRAGLIADIAVLFNMLLQLATLSMLGAAMTLPGIAGLALTLGIAVDANVLINERIREEIRAGRSPRAAVDTGYDKAFTAILDGHMTTLISGLILAQYGTGPIKGFAVTLIVGMVTSLFASIVCTRLMFDFAVRHRRVQSLSLG